EAQAERKRVRMELEGSYESLFHQTRIPAFVLSLWDSDLAQALRGPHLERAIGVIYLPETERMSHYFRGRLPEQFDPVIHIDRTKALLPLERTSTWEAGETPETYPFAVGRAECTRKSALIAGHLGLHFAIRLTKYTTASGGRYGCFSNAVFAVP